MVVGNPPWGYPKKTDEIGTRALASTLKWCRENENRQIGDKELSQAFIHLSLSLTAEGGRIGLLVSSGIFFKQKEQSKAFRTSWLSNCKLRQVVNFAHVRKLFFSDSEREAKAISPFASVIFDKKPITSIDDHIFSYWTAKHTAMIESTQAVVLNSGDMHRLSQNACKSYDKLWKIYWWGGYADENLIRLLDSEPKLIDLPGIHPGTSVKSGMGFLAGKGKYDSSWLLRFKELSTDRLSRYGRINKQELLTPPAKVNRRGIREVYEGKRLLVRRGVPSGGKLTIRLESEECCFRHSIIGIRLEGFESWQEKTMIAIFWSSLAQYYFFLTTGSWGMWHDEILEEAVERIPVRFPRSKRLKDRIVRLVDELQKLELEPDGMELAAIAANKRCPELEAQLNEAVFELFELTQREKDLVTDMTQLGLDFYYRNKASIASSPVDCSVGMSGNVESISVSEGGIAS